MNTSEKPLTLTVPQAGRKYFSIGRDASYEAARNGQMPTLRFGRSYRVPVAACERMLETATQPQMVDGVARGLPGNDREDGDGPADGDDKEDDDGPPDGRRGRA